MPVPERHDFPKAWTVLALAAAVLGSAASARADEAIGSAAAKTIPIADVHFHVMPWMEPAELLRRMDANRVQWAGGAAPFPEKTGAGSAEATAARTAAIGAALGSRYIRASGQGQWINLKVTGGVEALQNADSPAFKSRLALIRKDLESGARVVGEIHVNTATSAPNELLRYTVKADAATLKALLALAAEYKAPLMVHAEWSGATPAEMGRLADSNRDGRLVLGHCGSTASAADIRAFFEKTANAFCDLSYRSPPLTSNPRIANRTIFSAANGLLPDWKQLILDFPDRFMVGVDEFGSHPAARWEAYQELIDNIRNGLLANLPGEVAEKVAYKNAQALFRLQ